jgi:hypothetical protein
MNTEPKILTLVAVAYHHSRLVFDCCLALLHDLNLRFRDKILNKLVGRRYLSPLFDPMWVLKQNTTINT